MWLPLRFELAEGNPCPLPASPQSHTYFLAWTCAASCIFHTFSLRRLLNPYMLHHPTRCPQASPAPLLSITLPLTTECTLNQGRFSLRRTKCALGVWFWGKSCCILHWRPQWSLVNCYWFFFFLVEGGDILHLSISLTERKRGFFACSSFSSPSSFLFPDSPSLTGSLDWCSACA